MSRFRLYPTPEQEQQLLTHCAHARFVWNLAVEQDSWWTRQRGSTPSFVAKCRQLTEARAEFEWLRAGSVNVQQQALRDYQQARTNFFAGTHRRPGWRKKGAGDGFRITDTCRFERLNRNWGRVLVPKVGWVRFRWSRNPGTAKSYRITQDRTGRWHLAFAVVPAPIPAPGNGRTVGVDRGVAVSAALSTGELLTVPVPAETQTARAVRMQRRMARARKGSKRRARAKTALAVIRGRDAARCKDWAEKTSTRLAREFDTIVFEDLKVANMTSSAKGTVERPGRNVRQKAGLNRAILASGWGQLRKRTEDKAPGRVRVVEAAYTSQRCSVCGCVDRSSRESQALFRCTACGYTANADVNAARNIAAGRAVTARGGTRLRVPKNREPQRASMPTGISRL